MEFLPRLSKNLLEIVVDAVDASELVLQIVGTIFENIPRAQVKSSKSPPLGLAKYLGNLFKPDPTNSKAVDFIFGVFSLFNSKEGKKIFRKGLNYDALEFFYDLYKGWDETSGDIPIELGDHLESLIDDPKCW
jgi:hypothetical protein